MKHAAAPEELYRNTAVRLADRSRAAMDRLRTEKRGDDPYLLAVGERIRERRLAAGLTVTDLSRALNGSRSFLSQLEHGFEDLRVTTVLRIAAALGCQPGDLLPPVTGVWQ